LISEKRFFVGIGAQKAATSWLYACLYQHPEVYAPIKETNFFSKSSEWNKGPQFYESVFSKSQGRLCGEISTSYLHNSDVCAARISNTLTNVKILVVVRDPVKRAISNYLNSLTSGELDGSVPFREILRRDAEYVERGLFGKHLKIYYELFGSENIHVIDYDDIKAKPEHVIRDLYRFLAINHSFRPWALFEKINPARVPKCVVIDRTIVMIARWLTLFGAHRIRWLVRRAGISEWIRNWNNKGTSSRNIISTAEHEKIFYEYFSADVQLLEQITGRNFKAWSIKGS
jgi:hypothetical protein